MISQWILGFLWQRLVQKTKRIQRPPFLLSHASTQDFLKAIPCHAWWAINCTVHVMSLSFESMLAIYYVPESFLSGIYRFQAWIVESLENPLLFGWCQCFLNFTKRECKYASSISSLAPYPTVQVLFGPEGEKGTADGAWLPTGTRSSIIHIVGQVDRSFVLVGSKHNLS